jgi:hypothetical protein
MRRRTLLPVALLALAATTLLTACGGSSTSGNVSVVLVDTSKSFCQALPNCQDKIDATVDDNLADLSKQGGSLRLLMIGSDTGAPVVASSNNDCTGLLRGAAACFPKPTLWGGIFGKSGTQRRAALQKIKADINAGLATPPHEGSSIIDAINAAQPYLNDRRLPAGQPQLVILSDMIEDSNSDIPPLTCTNVGTPAKDAHVLDLLQGQGRLPDLHYVTVEVYGANDRNRLNGSCRAHFWHSYFARSGADLFTWQGL